MRYLLLFFFLSTEISSIAQNASDHSNNRIVLPQVSVSAQKPFGDLENRFGKNAAICPSVLWKFKNNFMLGIGGAWIFGNTVKNKNLFDNIIGPSGQIIDNNGNFSVVEVNQRGFYSTINFGYLWKTLLHHKNAGFYSSLGFGYLQHKINIQAPEATVPQLNGEYLKGYDRLTGGTAIRMLHGLLFISNNRRVNFTVSLETIYAHTKNMRSYHFQPYGSEKSPRKDILFGGQMGIVLPIFLKDKNEEYFYFD